MFDFSNYSAKSKYCNDSKKSVSNEWWCCIKAINVLDSNGRF